MDGTVSRENLLAGLAAGMMIVNMKTPQILETIIKERVSRFSDADISAFSQGVVCSMVMRQDTSPNEQHALDFVRHVPAESVAARWETIVAEPARLAIQTLHPLLRAERRLDQICCYRPIADLRAAPAWRSASTAPVAPPAIN
jgi:hypothetical protein